jgi:hypothetical protein
MPKLTSTATTTVPNLNDANHSAVPNSSAAQQQRILELLGIQPPWPQRDR